MYNERLDEYRYVEEMGFDGIMVNEHHNNPMCMSPRATVVASALAAITQNIHIVGLGWPAPLYDNPIMLAEELGMIDMISKGRLVAGLVRGGGNEQLALDTNSTHNRERFEEAHDLLVKIWTEPGPFRWEGKQYQFRVVNPWALPMQKPHPRIWIPGTVSPETIVWAAKHAYPYIALATTIPMTKEIWALYNEVARAEGYEAGPEHRGYNLHCHVAETEAKAIRNAREFIWMQTVKVKRMPAWGSPPGYMTAEARKLAGPRMAYRTGAISFEQQLEDGTIIAGTPKQVIARIRTLLEETHPGILVLWANDGRVNHEDSLTCIRLFGQEVIPAIKDIAGRLNLKSPFEANAPVSLATAPPSFRRAAA